MSDERHGPLIAHRTFFGRGRRGVSATLSHLETIGVRELRRDASRWLARARAGEVITITDRGRPVAQLGPLPEPSGYEALVAAGKVTPGDGRSLREWRADVDRDFPIEPGGVPLSEILEEMRRDERY